MRNFCLALVVVVLGLCRPAAALDPATTGVVLLHGKWGGAGQMEVVADALHAAGFVTESPTMPWAGSRLFDRDYEGAMEEIDAASARLRAKGVSRVVVLGQSLGSNAALHYATLGRPLAATVLIAPAHMPESAGLREKTRGDVDYARGRVAKGEGDGRGAYTSHNSGNRTRTITMSATAFLSYYDPDGPANMRLAAPRVGTAPILWLAPTGDPSTAVFADKVAPQLPATTRIERIDVDSDHMGAPAAAADKAAAWLVALVE